MQANHNVFKVAIGICAWALLLVPAESGAASPDHISIAHDLIPGPADFRVETNGVCRWRSLPILPDSRSQPHYALIRHDGSVAFRNSFWPEGSVQATVMDMASLEGGGAVITAGAIRPDGAIARGFMVVRPDGNTDRFIRTDGFIPRNVAVGADDSVWIIGRMTSQAFGKLEEGQRVQSGIARKYSLEGEFLGEHLPLSRFDDPSLHPTGTNGRGGRTFVRSLRDGIGFYSGMTAEWFELDADGQLVRRAHLPAASVLSLAITSSGRVFAWISGRRFGTYELDPAAEAWTAVPGWVGTITAPPRVGLFYGARGESLAFQELPALPNLRFVKAPAPAR